MSIANENPQSPPRNGLLGETPPPRRLKVDALDESERNFALAMHLSPLAAMVLSSVFLPVLLAPLVLWLVRKDRSAFNDDHGREVMNFCLSMLVLSIGLAITFVGLLLIPVLVIVGIVNMIRGAIAASNGEYFRYPMTIRFIS